MKNEFIGLPKEKTTWQELKPLGKLIVGFLFIFLILDWAVFSFYLDLIPTKTLIVMVGSANMIVVCLLFIFLMVELKRIRRAQMRLDRG